ncbi:MAG TPA: 30S ribosomal protein S6 [Candidatus Binataceae bacterium]|nr:30S ribosomal protein S6 [Candidatus Binataceae bacterium]
MRRYETIFIIRPDVGEPQIKDIIKRFEGIATSASGEIIETEEWGFRELAYHIKGERRGYYVRLDYASDAATMNEIERNLKLQDTVLRYLSVLIDVEADVAKAREEIDARKRRIAEARAAAEARMAAAAAQRAEAAAAASQAESAAAAPEEEIPDAPDEITEPEGGRE